MCIVHSHAFNSEFINDCIIFQIINFHCSLYNSFQLWLEETRLNKILHLRPESFPPAYDLNRLALIFANNNVCLIKVAKLKLFRIVDLCDYFSL